MMIVDDENKFIKTERKHFFCDFDLFGETDLSFEEFRAQRYFQAKKKKEEDERTRKLILHLESKIDNLESLVMNQKQEIDHLKDRLSGVECPKRVQSKDISVNTTTRVTSSSQHDFIKPKSPAPGPLIDFRDESARIEQTRDPNDFSIFEDPPSTVTDTSMANDTVPTPQPTSQPSSQPTSQPTSQPASQSSLSQPVSQPSSQSSSQPFSQPLSQPLSQQFPNQSYS